MPSNWIYEPSPGFLYTTYSLEKNRSTLLSERFFGIKEVNIIVPNKVVEVIFKNGDKQKSVCQEPDVFSLETAISICITKHMFGGSSAYNNAVKKGLKVYENQVKEKEQKRLEQERIEKKRAKKLAKRKKHAEEKAAQKREEQINIQKEAYVRAMRELEKVK